jgi:hypothetical protein
MTREQAQPYISFIVDDALSCRKALPHVVEGTVMPLHTNEGLSVPLDKCTLVGWQCGFEPLFVAVHSYLPDVILDDDEAEELAADALNERGWFGESYTVRPADYILRP